MHGVVVVPPGRRRLRPSPPFSAAVLTCLVAWLLFVLCKVPLSARLEAARRPGTGVRRCRGGDGGHPGPPPPPMFDFENQGAGRQKVPHINLGRTTAQSLPVESKMFRDPSSSDVEGQAAAQSSATNKNGQVEEEEEDEVTFNKARDTYKGTWTLSSEERADEQVADLHERLKKINMTDESILMNPVKNLTRMVKPEEARRVVDTQAIEAQRTQAKNFQKQYLGYAASSSDTDMRWIRKLNLSAVLEIPEDEGSTTKRDFGHGTVTTIAGSPVWVQEPMAEDLELFDGVGTNAWFFTPGAIAQNPLTGDVFVNEIDRGYIRKLSRLPAPTAPPPTPPVEDEDGGGGAPASQPYLVNVTTVSKHAQHAMHPELIDGPLSSAHFSYVTAMQFHPQTNELYVADSNHHVIRVISTDGETRVFAGVGEEPGLVDGDRTEAEFFYPYGMAIGPQTGTVYVSQPSQEVIRAIHPDGQTSVYAGKVNMRGYEHGFRLNATLACPRSLACDKDENLYFVDYRISTVRKIDFKTGMITKVAGAKGKVPSGGIDGYPDEATFSRPEDIKVDRFGNILVADSWGQRIRIIYHEDEDVYGVAGRVVGERILEDPDGEIELDDTNPDGYAKMAYIRFPTMIAIGRDDDIFITDKMTNNIRRLDAYLPVSRGGTNHSRDDDEKRVELNSARKEHQRKDNADREFYGLPKLTPGEAHMTDPKAFPYLNEGIPSEDDPEDAPYEGD